MIKSRSNLGFANDVFESPAGEGREQKHIALMQAVDGIDIVIDQARELLLRIASGGVKETTGSDPNCKQTLCLFEVLTAGPQQIRSKRDELSKILYEIENALF